MQVLGCVIPSSSVLIPSSLVVITYWRLGFSSLFFGVFLGFWDSHDRWWWWWCPWFCEQSSHVTLLTWVGWVRGLFLLHFIWGILEFGIGGLKCFASRICGRTCTMMMPLLLHLCFGIIRNEWVLQFRLDCSPLWSFPSNLGDVNWRSLPLEFGGSDPESEGSVAAWWTSHNTHHIFNHSSHSSLVSVDYKEQALGMELDLRIWRSLLLEFGESDPNRRIGCLCVTINITQQPSHVWSDHISHSYPVPSSITKREHSHVRFALAIDFEVVCF